MDRESITELLVPLCTAARRVRAAEIDAACCQTRSDWEKLHKLEAEFEELFEVTTLKLGALALRNK